MILEPALVNSINKINEILEDEEIDKMYKKRILGYKYKLKKCLNFQVSVSSGFTGQPLIKYCRSTVIVRKESSIRRFLMCGYGAAANF